MLKRIINTGLLIILFSLAAQAQTVDDIIQKYIEAKGGVMLITSTQSLKITGKQEAQGQEAKITIYYKRPDLYKMEINVNNMKIVQAFDGKEGWYINPMTGSTKPQLMPNEILSKLREQINILEGPLFDYKNKGIKAELIGKEKVKGKESYKLKITSSDNETIYLFIDAKTYLVQKVQTELELTQKGRKNKVETYNKNYKTIKGLTIPFKQETYVDGNLVSSLIYTKVTPNAELKDAIFKKPKK